MLSLLVKLVPSTLVTCFAVYYVYEAYHYVAYVINFASTH